MVYFAIFVVIQFCRYSMFICQFRFLLCSILYDHVSVAFIVYFVLTCCCSKRISQIGINKVSLNLKLQGLKFYVKTVQRKSRTTHTVSLTGDVC